MRKVMFFCFLALSVLLSGGQLYAGVTVGEAAPDFTLPDIEGSESALSDYEGQTVVLEWINHGCPFVKKHYDSGNMQGLQEEFTNQDVVWISIASSAPGKQGHFEADEWLKVNAEKGSAATAVLLDPAGDVGRLYGAKTTPHMYIVDPEGTLIYQGAIDDTPSADSADIASSTNYVRQALTESLSGNSVSQPSTKAYGCSVKY